MLSGNKISTRSLITTETWKKPKSCNQLFLLMAQHWHLQEQWWPCSGHVWTYATDAQRNPSTWICIQVPRTWYLYVSVNYFSAESCVLLIDWSTSLIFSDFRDVCLRRSRQRQRPQQHSCGDSRSWGGPHPRTPAATPAGPTATPLPRALTPLRRSSKWTARFG